MLAALALAVVVLNWTYGRFPPSPSRPARSPRSASYGSTTSNIPGAARRWCSSTACRGRREDWEDVTPLLAGRRTIAIDRPGFGYSTGGYVPFDRQLEAIHELLAKLRVARPILVGHSYGGTISLGFAERYPSEVRGLVLVDAAAAGTHPGAFEAQAHPCSSCSCRSSGRSPTSRFSQLLRKVVR